ncbi:AAA family ATPase, partial [Kutzneria sp. 744]|uniref:bifunctional aminoglycoside phosphotransferase/ATP-binding protein n=1 Tax=Kutzneria sp. (strain 744) TaxID=345341 RepID=UPI0005B83F94
DALDDTAFLAMDLERLGRPDLGAWFLDCYAEFSGAERSVALEHHYIAYRAVVRSKVACLRHAQGVAGQDVLARQLAGLALRHLRLAEPRLMLVGGRPGTGKSTVAGRLADEAGGVLVQSDRVRKELAGIDPEQSAEAGWQQGIYDVASTEHTYREMLRRAELLLGRGETVVLDASWRVAAHREMARVVAAGTSSRLVELVCRAPGVVADARIRTRAGGPHLSDATPEIAAAMAEAFDPWPEADVVDTDSPAR